MRTEENYTLLAPGPVAVSKAAIDELVKPMIHHRTPEFTSIFKRVLTNLKSVFQTRQPVMILTSSGSGAMEAALVNTLSAGDSVVCIVSGKFGRRWEEMAQVYGLNVTSIDVEEGEAVCPDEVKAVLDNNPQIKAVFCQACETSTGVLHPIKELAALTKEHDALMIVDGITALCANPLPMDEWGIDVLVGGSQKAFMIPTGLGLIALSEKAWKASEKSSLPKYYFDLKAERKAHERGQTHFSSAVSHIRALDAVLIDILDQGLDSLLELVNRRAQATRQAGKILGLELFPDTPAPALSAFKVPEGIDGAALRSLIEKDFRVTLMGGQDGLKGKIIRIGHIGALDPQDTLGGIKALAQGLQAMGV